MECVPVGEVGDEQGERNQIREAATVESSGESQRGELRVMREVKLTQRLSPLPCEPFERPP